MQEPGARGFAAELHTVSPRLIVAALLTAAVLLTAWGDVLPHPSLWWNYALVLFLTAPIGLALELWRPSLGRWYTLLILTAAIWLANAWFDLPGAPTLLALVVAFAAAMIGLPAAAVTAVGESGLLLLFARYPSAHVSLRTLLTALPGIWAMLAIMVMVYRPICQLADWSWDYYVRARGSLEEARSRGAELKQALHDLAHANRQLALTNERLNAARLAAEEAQRTKAAFVANVSHEFRTPLNMIIGLTEFVLGRPGVYGSVLPQALLDDLEIVRRNSEHLSSMISDVLDLSRVESGRMALHKERVDLGEVIERAFSVVQPLLAKKKLALQREIPTSLPQIFCDRTRIRQVVVNLLSNAARYTEQGAITVRVALEPQHVVVSVTDTGPGIVPEEAAQLFEPFHQSASGARAGGGSGLGLSISKQFVELHDGQMWLESEPGLGSTFSFRLPISPLPAPLARPDRWITEAWSWVERTSRSSLPVLPNKPRIIVCDGSGELHPLLARHTDGVEWVNTRDLAEAAAELQRCPAESVLLNVPSLNDLNAQLLQAAEAIRDTPLIACTLPPRIGRALAAGAAGFLTKPVTRDRLQQALASAGRPVTRVLLVDDDRDTQQLFARMLGDCAPHLEVMTASSGQEALDRMRAWRPDLVLLDIILPDMDGWQLLEVKREDTALREVPVMIVTAQDPQDHPLASRVVAATIGEGVSLSKLLRCSRAVSALLLQPD